LLSVIRGAMDMTLESARRRGGYDHASGSRSDFACNGGAIGRTAAPDTLDYVWASSDVHARALSRPRGMVASDPGAAGLKPCGARAKGRTNMLDPALERKVVLITGANHGIGAATARLFAEQGAGVFLTYYRPPCPYSVAQLQRAREAGVGGDVLYRALQQQAIEPLLEELRAMGGAAQAYEADLADSANVPMLFDACEATLGPVDVLVNNHTLCVLETFDPARVRAEGENEAGVHLVSAVRIDAHFAVNARAYALLMAEYVRRYLNRGARVGRIVNLSTDAAHAHAANVSYAASKHAIESYSRSAAIELGQYGITVNVVAPGPIQTGYLTPEDIAQIEVETPLRRVGRPEDVAEVILFLASQQARWLTPANYSTSGAAGECHNEGMAQPDKHDRTWHNRQRDR